MNARFFNMLHDAGHHASRAIRHRVDVNFNGVLQKFVDEHRMFRGSFDGHPHEVFEGSFVIHDLHRTTPEDIRRPDQHGIPDFRRHLFRFSD